MLMNFLFSLRAFIMVFISHGYLFSIFRRRKNGISVLLPTQNEEKIVKLSILSFLDFADEIIIVDNGSNDKTIEIVTNLSKTFPKIKFYNKPELPDLYHNRQFALKQSKFRWICRFDSDFVAYTDGENNILKLRNFLLKMPRGIIPKAISFYYLNIGIDFWHIRLYDFSIKNKIKVIAGPRMSIYEYFPFFTFGRFKGREYGTFQPFLNNIILNRVFYFHCIIKSDLDFFLRSERSNWRKTNNFKKYPTLVSYIKDIIQEKYQTSNVKKALETFSVRVIYNKKFYKKYDPEKYLPYPSLIKERMKEKDVYRISKLQ